MAGPPLRQRTTDRVRLRIARSLGLLPPPWQVRLSGQPAVRVDGLTLDPNLQLLLALERRQASVAFSAMTVAQVREWARRQAAAATGRPIRVGAVTGRTVDGAAGPLPARHYAPPDQVCRLLCRYAGVHVLSVAYRLAPEHRFPAAVDDARAALRWACANAKALGADPRRVAIGGDSAGGNLSTVVARLATLDGGPAPAAQLLLYPPTDRAGRYPSLELFADGFFLTREQVDWYDGHYLGNTGTAPTDPLRSPLHAADLSGLAPALVVTAGFDPLRDEGEAYAAALAAAGTPVTLRRQAGMIHGFANMVDVSAPARTELIEVARDLRALLARVNERPGSG